MKRAKRKYGFFAINDHGLTSGTNEWRMNYQGEVFTPTYLLDYLRTMMTYKSTESAGNLLYDVKSVINYDIRSVNPRYTVYL